MDRHGYFTVRDIVDFAYCPRSIYFQHCIKAGKESTPKMEKGRELHEHFVDKSLRTKILKGLPRLPREYEVRLSSEKYNFNARIDCILFSGEEAYPVEFKSSPRPEILYNTYKYQMVAQALVIEEVLGKKVSCAYIKYVDGCIAKLPIKAELKEKVAEILEEMDEIVRYEKIPMPAKSMKKCQNCFYKDICRRL